MPRIDHIIGDGPELAQSQKRVLEVLEKHPDYLFRMNIDDLHELRAWVTAPDDPEPPRVWRNDSAYSSGTIKWALSTLRARNKISSVKLHGRSYYGSHEAVKRADREKTMKSESPLSPTS